MWRGSCSTRDMFVRDVQRSGRWFPERGCSLLHQTVRFAKMILRDRCSTSYDLASLFPSRCATLDRWSGKIAKRTAMELSALHSTFHFWGKPRRIASFLMLPTSRIEEVPRFVFDIVKVKKAKEASQNCSVFDVVKFTSRWVASFSSLQIDR